MKKRIFSMLISLALVLGMVVGFAFTAEAAEDTDYTGYYKIGNAGQLSWFACLVVGDTSQSGITAAEPNAKAVLTADIDITVLAERFGKTWSGIGTADIPFTGIFDGNGYTIKGLTIDTTLTKPTVATIPVDTTYQGLFGVIGEGGVVRDVVLEGTASVSDGMKLGAVCSQNNGTIENVLSLMTVTGGDSPDAFCHTNNGTITNCYTNQSGAADATLTNSTALADGSVTYALGAAFGQTIGTDLQPVHYNNNRVYKSGDTYSNTDPSAVTICTVTDKDGVEIGKYSSLQTAIDKAAESEGATVKLVGVDNVKLDTYVTVKSGNFTLDLADKTLSTDSDYVIRIEGGTLAVVNTAGGTLTGGEDDTFVYYGGTIDLTGYSNPAGLSVLNRSGGSVALSYVKLPENYEFSYINVTGNALVKDLTYTIYKKHTVTFDANDGECDTASLQTLNLMLAKLPAATREKYTFLGWFDAAEGGEQITTSTTFSEDTTVYAQWEELTYTVAVTNGTGGGSYAEGETVTVTANAPESGKGFKEWSGTDGLTITAGNTESTSFTFTMPANGVAIEATYDDADVFVKGIGLLDGKYLDENGNVSDTKPSGGYAYLNGGTLTLDNIEVNNENGSGIYAENVNLTVHGVGTNSVKGTFVNEGVDADKGYGICVQNGSLTLTGIIGDITAGGDGICGTSGVNIKGTVGDIKAGDRGIYSINSMGNVTVEKDAEIGDITADSDGIDGAGEVTINGTVGDIKAGECGIHGGSITIAGTVGSIVGGNAESGGAGINAYGWDEFDEDAEEFVKMGGDVSISGTVGKITGGLCGVWAEGDFTVEETNVEITVLYTDGYAVAAYKGIGCTNVIITVPENYTSDALDEDYTVICNSDGSYALTVKFEIGYTVWFDVGDSTTFIDIQHVVKGGTVSTPTAPTLSGYTFGGWYTDEECTVKYDFTTPVTADITLYAKWEKKSTGTAASTTTYRVTVEDTDGGTVSVSDTTPKKGDTVTITPKAEDGKVVDSVTVTDKNGKAVDVTDKGDGTYSFKQPSSNVTVKVTFADEKKEHVCPSKAFSDLDISAWYHEATDYVLANGLMQGMSDGVFAPDVSTSRAMLVTVLWRLEGKPVVNYLMTFEDVDSDAWYAEAVRWAASEGIVKGYSDTVFAPDDNITREQLAALFYRYEQYKGGGFTGAWMFLLDFTTALI